MMWEQGEDGDYYLSTRYSTFDEESLFFHLIRCCKHDGMSNIEAASECLQVAKIIANNRDIGVIISTIKDNLIPIERYAMTIDEAYRDRIL